MTVQQINQMIRDAEKEQRRQGITPHRAPTKRHPTRMVVKQSLRREQW